MKILGLISTAQMQTVQSAMTHPSILYSAVFDRTALWDPTTIDKVLDSFPKGYVDESDLFLVLAECIANSVLHGQADVLGFHVRVRANVLLLSFYQMPRMQERVGLVLGMAKSGQIKECAAELPGGLGFPILLRLVHRITISNDYNKLQLWMRIKRT